VDIFVRHGKRLKRVTEPGLDVLKSVEIILREVANLKRIGEEFSKQDAGRLSIAATHTQARYALPKVIAEFKREYPGVHLVLHQGSPREIADLLASGEADLAVATENLDLTPDLVTFPAFSSVASPLNCGSTTSGESLGANNARRPSAYTTPAKTRNGQLRE